MTMTASPVFKYSILLLCFLGLQSCFTLVSASNAESTEWLAQNAKKDGVITLPSGLQYKVLTKGSGGFHPTIDSSTSCHYEGKLINGDKFDSSYDRGSPTSFAPNQVIKGWTEIMQLMVEGDKFEIYISSELGYGERGSPPKIQGGDALIFIMEMIEIEGDKVPAVLCDVVTMESCSDKEKAYIEKAKGKFQDKSAMQAEIDRIGRVSGNVSDTAKSWANIRIKLLANMKLVESEEL